MKQLSLKKQGHAIVDDADYEELRKFRWALTPNGYVRLLGGRGNHGPEARTNFPTLVTMTETPHSR